VAPLSRQSACRGALAAAAVPIDAAVVNQLVVSYAPALPGWFATEDLLRAEYR
jgi:hypothetical protein